MIDLLDNAKESIVMSMYLIKALDKGPIRLLVRDLEEALDRGVKVDIYLNTRFSRNQSSNVAAGEPFDILRAKGANIYFVAAHRRLHDKLIIVDKRYVVEGSVNWSVSAIKDNFESAVLIDSPGLAELKISRLRRLPLKGQPIKGSQRPDREKQPNALVDDGCISISKSLLEDKDLFPRMINTRDARAMDTYLLLLLHAKIWDNSEFFLSLEEIAIDLNMPDDWSDTALRRQVIKTLKKLEDKYNLIDVDFRHSQDAWVTISELKGGSFNLDISSLQEDFLSAKNPSSKAVVLIKTVLKQEGKSIDSFTITELANRFHMSKNTLKRQLHRDS
ncbi:phospholipase D-like domain-containing protein [Candidatus Omnitrophota bacterium]